ncbi:T9SS type B sorting domain-containing protein [Lacinutrix sp. WUR7]|uniref:T9SS type B sorting domain-containing protein n=1 Tax=Lacinutrix sp. WUR7 TaxID=2653681 RepID=UPI00193D9756|nr:T9SS type B sorting domain-containing protein [Lacinutrix sp. WUR7]QRM89666.1 T9SS type B sorting domain-containing protein [Lacinutrix sp. WUR7]
MKRIKLLLVFICTFFIYNASNAFNTNKNITDNTKASSFCPAPVVTSFFPSSGPEDTLVYISGSDFTTAATVAFDGISATFTIIDDNEIEAYIPAGISASSNITITSTGGCVGNSVTDFTLLASECTTADVYISEIYDANSGSYAVIELYNPTNAPVVLDGVYIIERFGDIGNAAPSHTYNVLGTIPPLDTFIIILGSGSDCPSLTADFNVSTGINDNDEFKLFKNGTLIDIVNAPADRGYTIIRNPDAAVTQTTYTASDWSINSNEDCSDLGSHTADPIPDNTPTITNPTSQTICENGTATFTTSISGSETYIYQWKVLNSAGNWINVVNDTNYSGATTATLTITNAPSTFDANQYYCEVTSASCDLVTNAAQLEINNMASTPILACWESATYDSATCSWVITGTQALAPTGLECWETATFNTTTCVWDVTGTQALAPTGLECWQTTTFNSTTCAWDIIGTQDPMPTGLECWETATFNTTTCAWVITGTQAAAPTTLECWETATFNTTTCVWDITGTQDPMPTLACWESATFDNTTCAWVITGTQATAPTALECWETATFNTTTCAWEITGTQDPMPTLQCWESASFDSTTCAWVVTGTQDPMPTGLACGQTATFNNTTCAWEIVTGTPDPMPTGLACWETATFNTTTCAWDITGTQDPMPTLQCWESASFDNTTCAWVVTGTFVDFTLDTSNITISGNTLTVNMTDTSINYEYTIDAGTFQTNPSFTNIANGIHTLTVQDENGCVIKSLPFTIEGVQEINIPLFFTPNGDNINDTWLITDTQNTIKQILIFNRYGKLLKEVSPAEKYWDGTYRGYNLESNDYWYLITLYTGEEFKGHFTLKR